MDAVESMLTRFQWSPCDKPVSSEGPLAGTRLFRWKNCRALIGPNWTTVYLKKTSEIDRLDSAKTDDLPAVRRLVEKLMGV